MLIAGDFTLEERSIILIVDDEPAGRRLLQREFETEGYQLVLAANGPEALIKAAEVTPDLILLDVMMPDMDGFEVCQRLRSDPLLAEVPIIIVTALDDSQAYLRGLEIGADDFVTKPFNRVALLARVRTITRLNRYRRLLSERAQRQQAEESERLKDRLISNISHELRTPLSVITLLSGNLDTLYDNLSDQKRRHMVQNIRKHAQVLNDLFENILEISRLENQKSAQIHEPLDLVRLVRQEIDEQFPLAQQHGLALLFTGADSLPIRGNEGQLRQVIRNLLNNAIKYTPPQGKIICECPLISQKPSFPARWPGNEWLEGRCWAAVRITDSGIGIAAEHLPHLFERFYRAKTQGNVPGTGLGLSIARELVELHQGHIAVASTLNQGSTFTVYLPLLDDAK